MAIPGHSMCSKMDKYANIFPFHFGAKEKNCIFVCEITYTNCVFFLSLTTSYYDLQDF